MSLRGVLNRLKDDAPAVIVGVGFVMMFAALVSTCDCSSSPEANQEQQLRDVKRFSVAVGEVQGRSCSFIGQRTRCVVITKQGNSLVAMLLRCEAGNCSVENPVGWQLPAPRECPKPEPVEKPHPDGPIIPTFDPPEEVAPLEPIDAGPEEE